MFIHLLSITSYLNLKWPLDFEKLFKNTMIVIVDYLIDQLVNEICPT
jgi:hypothetical protein